MRSRRDNILLTVVGMQMNMTPFNKKRVLGSGDKWKGY
jgi:hypothetical protein